MLSAAAAAYVVAVSEPVPIDAGPLAGDLTVPADARGVVVFAHGSGSSRHSPRNVAVARTLNAAGLGTLLIDLLTEAEEANRGNVFDIPLLAGRLRAATEWLATRPRLAALPVGHFGASTGAAAALVAAAEAGPAVGAVVSRGGRPDLAGAALRDVTAPTLLIVGGDDREVLRLNEQAAQQLRCAHRIAVVPGAGHLFAEPGALEAVAELSVDWFTEHLAAGAAAPAGE